MIEAEVGSREKVKALLRELFQFDVQDLDFGIYRIMNFKRKEIQSFIEGDLIKAVEKEFEDYAKVSMIDLQREVEKLKSEINRDFGEGTIDGQGRVTKNHDAPKVQEYLEKIDEVKNATLTQGQIEDVFNHIYEFFSRYYDQGDFLSKKRIGGKEKYYVPYSGEEVVFHWANNDQYYVKTGEYFRRYSFTAGGYRVSFVLKEVEEELNSVIGEPKYFVLCEDESSRLDTRRKELEIFFNWRMLTDEERKQIGTRNPQEAITSSALNMLFSEIGDKGPANELRMKEGDRSVLERHLRKYVQRNTTDYFVHKNLKSFLERELDFYIKSEVLDLDEIERMDERNIRLNKAKMRVLREICKKIIEFLGQIENFQKMVFEKKKFIIGTEYVITLDKIKEYAGEEFLESILDEVLKDTEQLEEWKDLFEVDVRSRKSLIEKQTVDKVEWKKLPIDTRHFDAEFKDKLIERLSAKHNLDENLDGILIKSENWQALNLVSSKFKERIRCIYIDPPFNTGTNEFLYKNNYLDSCWVAMMYDRLRMGKLVLRSDGSIYVRIDYHGNHYVRMLMDLIFDQNFANEIIINRTKKVFEGASRFITANDSLFMYPKSERALFNIVKKGREEQKWIPAHSPGIRWSEVSEKYRSYYKPSQLKHERGKYYSRGRVFKGKVCMPPDDRHWTFSQERLEEYDKEGRITLNERGILEYLTSPQETVDSNWTDIPGYVVPSKWGFPTENSEQLLQRVIEASSNKSEFVLDYFLGSGATIAVAHKLGRKWIGIEMGEHFNAIPLKRMKMVLAGEESGISKEVDWKGGGFFKYHFIEQYEDALNNIVFLEKDKTVEQTLDRFQDYFLRYMLDYETRDSPTRLLAEKFQMPFEYKIKTLNGNVEREENVDLVETFNYILGLKIEKTLALKNEERLYRVVFGKQGSINTVVIWRNTKALDLEKDRKFIEGMILAGTSPDRILINGDSYVKNAQAIEPEFKKLMGA